MAQPIQYAQLPNYEYQKTIERHYQTFDPHTLKFSYYPVHSASTDGLTPNKDQGNTDAPAADPPKDDPVPDPAPAIEEGSDSPADASSSSPEAGGMLMHPLSLATSNLPTIFLAYHSTLSSFLIAPLPSLIYDIWCNCN